MPDYRWSVEGDYTHMLTAVDVSDPDGYADLRAIKASGLSDAQAQAESFAVELAAFYKCPRLVTIEELSR